MNYICKVIGDLSIVDRDFKLNMYFNEVIDLSPDDFKVSPRLRAALRNKELEVYTPKLHQNIKRKKKAHSMNILKEKVLPFTNSKNESSTKELNDMKTTLDGISNKMSNVLYKLDDLVTQVISSSDSLNENFNKFFKRIESNPVNSRLEDLLAKVIETQDKLSFFLEDNLKQTKNEDKIDKLIDNLEVILSNGIPSKNSVNNLSKNSKIKKDIYEDNEIYIPKIETNLSKKNIVTENMESEGTDSILEKLKNLNR